MKIIFKAVLFLCFAKDSLQSSLFDNFVTEVRPHFTSSLSQLNNLVVVSLSFDDSSQPLNANYFRNPAIQNAIRDTHAPLITALSIADRHVAEYDTTIATAAAEIGATEAQIGDHQSSLATLQRQREEQQNLVASLQGSIDHSQRLINEHRNQLEQQQRKLQTVRKRRKWFGFVTIVVPVVGIPGMLINHIDVDKVKGNIRTLENNLQNFRNSKQQAENQLNHINSQIQATDQAIRDTQSLLHQKQNSLQVLQGERSLVIELGIKLKNSNTFLSQFEGKLDVMDTSNQVTFVFESVLNSLEDLLVFLSNNISNNVAPLTTTQALQQLRQLLQQTLV